MKVMVTGASGQLGCCLKEQLALRTDLRCTFLTKAELDITDEAAVKKQVEEISPSWVINAASYTAVDRAEDDRETAYNVNVRGVSYLAQQAKRVGASLMHVSTDYVFDGMSGGTPDRPYLEADTLHPLSFYGLTKLESESTIRNTTDRYVIIRTAWLFSRFGENFVLKILDKIRRGESLKVVTDQIGSPTNALDLARAVERIIDYPHWGTFHVVNREAASWYDVAEAVAKEWGAEMNIEEIHSDTLNQRAVRPRNSVLDPTRFEDTFGMDMRSWRKALHEMISVLKAENGRSGKCAVL